MAANECPMPLFVVSFNVLSSALSPASHFSKALPEDCLAANRFKAVVQKLTEYISKGMIICLQELSREWHASLISFFRMHGYTIVASLYGNAKNGYMGVAIAYSDALYDIIEVRDQCVADCANWAATEVLPAPQTWGLSTWTTWLNYYSQQYTRQNTSRSEEDAVAIAREKSNTLLMLRLSPRGESTPQEFVVGTYHMPCAYMHRCVMVLHATAVVRQIQEFARGGVAGDTPLILAGDFNMNPDSEEYNLVTCGAISPELVHEFWIRYPKLSQEDYELSAPLISAYHAILGKEPAFTCYATTCYKGVEKDFIGTIDYIFTSDHFKPHEIIVLPRKPLAEYGASLPSKTNPSDHLPIGVQLQLHDK